MLCFRLRMILLLGILAAGCGKAEDQQADNTLPPTVPQPGTLTLEVNTLGSSSGFGSNDSSWDNGRIELLGTNHSLASLIVGATSLSVAGQLAVPTAAVRAALSQTPTFNAEAKSWIWAYQFSASGTSYTANLSGTRTGEASASWSFAVTKSPADANGCCDNFVWLSGATDTASSGTWVINDPTTPSTLTPHRLVDWNYTAETEKTMRVVVKKVEESSDWVVDGFVNYTASPTTVQMTVEKNPSTAEKFVVDWNRTTRAGSLIKEDNTTVCWDATLANTPCG